MRTELWLHEIKIKKVTKIGKIKIRKILLEVWNRRMSKYPKKRKLCPEFQLQIWKEKALILESRIS